MTSPDPFLNSSSRALSSRTSEAIGRNPDRRTGVVVSFEDGVLMVRVAGGNVTRCGYLDSYMPIVNDVVALVLQRSTWLCLGRMENRLGTGVPVGAIIGGVRFLTFTSLINISGAETLIPNYTMTIPVVENHLVGIRVQFRVRASAPTGGAPFSRIREDDLTGPSIYEEFVQLQHVPTNNHVINNWMAWHRPTTTGMKTFVFTAQSAAGTFNYAHGGGDAFLAFNYGLAPQIAA